MKFLADMGIAQSTVRWLTEQGHEATHVRALQMHRARDEEIMAKAKQHESTVPYKTGGPALHDAENVRL